MKIILTEEQTKTLLFNEINDHYHQKYLKWKRKNVTLRGLKDRYSENNGGARFGDGLYTAFLGNRQMAKGYGNVYFVLNAIPKNPKILRDTNLAEIFIQNLINNWCKNHNMSYNPNEFYEKTDIRTEMLNLGYDGLAIKGREMVNYTPPDNVKYFETENQLMKYYDDFIDENLNEHNSLPNFYERLITYKELGRDFTIKTNDEYLLWVVEQMKGVINNLNNNNINSDDYTNVGNLGFKPNGNIGYFDIGYGDYFENFENEPQHIEIDEVNVGIRKNIVDKIIKKYSQIISKKLGKGGYFGMAFDIGNNKVLKFTKDKSEAVNSSKIVGKHNEHLADIYDVKKYVNKNETIYLILIEKLITSNKIKQSFNKINDIILKSENKHINPSIINIIKKNHPFVGEFLGYMYKNGYDETWKKYIDKVDQYKQYDFNDISDLSQWIYGSKDNEGDYGKEPPTYIFKLLKDLVVNKK